MKKIEKSAHFLRENSALFQCPVCQDDFLEVNSHQMICIQGHSFNLSKKGTVHFLLKQPHNDYGSEMLKSRRIIAQDGLWHPMLQEVFQTVSKKDGVHLDVGCGEGSHLHHLHEMGLEGLKIGFDISKDAIQLAAALYTEAFWSVADLARSPFASNAYDTIFNILSPSNYSEFDRLLKKGGQVIKVIPSERYLIEVRELTGNDEKPYSNQDVVEKFFDHYPGAEKISIQYKHDLKPSLAPLLVEMTPLGWNAAEQIDLKGLKSVTVEMEILVGTKA
ncbi:methyltransferase domain-containing protein [Marinilactibacillus sp. Marseille-P9653]|uniref:methyltransferase domain-containing protein n=1 Tax=Marinilactibacillus sp. Marseille-P9653 TaxID=2866583 RepID=UPI001CE3ED39|nr:methyltransferase domain-containing protein [Marinilactibacillus sp. Marseille-P9653]